MLPVEEYLNKDSRFQGQLFSVFTPSILLAFLNTIMIFGSDTFGAGVSLSAINQHAIKPDSELLVENPGSVLAQDGQLQTRVAVFIAGRWGRSAK